MLTDDGNPRFRAVKGEARMVPNKVNCGDNEARGTRRKFLGKSSDRWVVSHFHVLLLVGGQLAAEKRGGLLLHEGGCRARAARHTCT